MLHCEKGLLDFFLILSLNFANCERFSSSIPIETPSQEAFSSYGLKEFCWQPDWNQTRVSYRCLACVCSMVKRDRYIVFLLNSVIKFWWLPAIAAWYKSWIFLKLTLGLWRDSCLYLVLHACVTIAVNRRVGIFSKIKCLLP